MINLRILGNGDVNWADIGNANLQAYKDLVWRLLNQTEGDHGGTPYWDTATNPKPTIGIGFNFSSTNPVVQDQVIQLMGFNPQLPSHQPYIQDLIIAINGLVANGSFSTVHSEVDTARQNGIVTRSSFAFTPAEISNMQPLLETVIANADFERRVDDFITGADASPERAALLSLGYTSNNLLGASLGAALANGDRAEAWFEIRYRSNGGGDDGIAKRRYIESQIFGLFDDGSDKPADVREAWLAFRMLTKHEQQISTYESQYSVNPSNPNLNPNNDLAVIDSGHAQFGTVKKLKDILLSNSQGSAKAILIENFADFDTLAPSLMSALQAANYTGALLNPNIEEIWVTSHLDITNEAPLLTVDRTGTGIAAANDLILGSLDSIPAYSGVHKAFAGAGSDFLVGSNSSEELNGGGDEDTVIYASSPSAVDVNLDNGVGAGGYAAGDDLTDIENLIGSNFDDKLTGGSDDNVLYGGAGNDTMIGGGGNDLLVGGDGDDDTYVFASSGYGADTVLDNKGKLVIDGTMVGEDLESQNHFARVVGTSGSTYELHHLGQTYQLSFDPIDTDKLIIQKGSDSIAIDDFSNGTFGISLIGRVTVDSGNLQLQDEIGAIFEELKIVDHEIVELEGGGFAAVWIGMASVPYYVDDGYHLGYVAQAANPNVYFQRFDAAGTPVGNKVQLDSSVQSINNYSSPSYIESNIEVSKLSNGDIAIAWIKVMGSPVNGEDFDYTSTIEGKVFSPGGELKSSLAAHPIDATTNSEWHSAWNLSVLPLQTGGFAASWVEHSNNSSVVRGINYGASGALTSNEYALLSGSQSPRITESAFASLTISSNVFVWSDSGVVKIQKLSLSGAPLEVAHVLGSGEGAVVKRLPDGNLLVLWQQSSQGGNAIVGVKLDSGLNSSSAPAVLVSHPTGMKFDAAIVGDDAFVLTYYEHDDSEDLDQTQFAAVYDFNFDIIGNEIEIESPLSLEPVSDWFSSSDRGLSLVALATGGYAFSYVEFETLGQLPSGDASVNTHLTVALVPGASDEGFNQIEGSAGNDLTNGTGGKDEIHGQSGNDQISSAGGDDRLIGGPGNDSLAGGDGFDVYVYKTGDGIDTIIDSGANRIQFVDIAFGQISIGIGSLILKVNGTSDEIHIAGFDPENPGAPIGISEFKFSDGSIKSLADILDIGFHFDGTSGADTLGGTNGKDFISGLAGNDTLVGKSGNDQLDGGLGNDTYQFSPNFGQDTIFDSDATAGNIDTIEFLTGIAASQVVVTRSGSNLLLSVDGTDSRISIQNWFSSGNAHKIEQIKFADQTTWDIAQTESKIVIPATQAADLIQGTESGEVINALGGNDTVNGNDGDDQITGGTGNDSLQGGAGSDAYYFGAGDGQDVINDGHDSSSSFDTVQYLTGVLPADVSVRRDHNHVYLERGNDRITLKDWFAEPGKRIEQVRFADNTVWTATDLNTRVTTASEGSDYLVGMAGDETLSGAGGADQIFGEGGDDDLTGGGGDDTVNGNDGNDTLAGGGGNDSLNGGSGNDSYLFNLGDGSAIVVDGDAQIGNSDTIKFGADILPSQIRVLADGQHLVMEVIGTTDRVTVQNWFAGAANQVEQVVFENEVVWTPEDVEAQIVIGGTSGNDTLSGTAGGNLFDGGAGNDLIYGFNAAASDSGNDTYLFATGFGQDTIQDYGSASGNQDTIKFTTAVPADVVAVHDFNSSGATDNLILKLPGSSNQITVVNYFNSNGNYKVEQVVFANSVVWGVTELDAAAFDLRSSTNSSLSRTTAGSDSYLFAAGAGQDTINDQDSTSGNIDTIKVTGVLPANVTLLRDPGSSGSADLLLKLNGANDVLRIQGQFHASGNYGIEKIVFDDGTIWNSTVIGATPIPITGATANGTSGSDIFDVRASASSTVYGYTSSASDSGNDTYYIGTGGGQDIIQDYGTSPGNADTIRVVGSLPSQVETFRSFSGSSPTSNLIISFIGSTDQVTVNNFFTSNGYYQIEQVIFDNGVAWDVVQLKQAAFNLMDGTNNTLSQTTAGNDAYSFGTGSGQDAITDQDSNAGNLDTIRIRGLTPDQLSLQREADGSGSANLLIKVSGTSDQLRVTNHFVTSGNYRIEQITFDDGTIWNSSVIGLAPITPTTTSAAQGTSAGDYFDLRNSANSTVHGYNASTGDSGNDTYIFGAGSGDDTLRDYGTGANTDTIKLVGLTPSQVTLLREADGSGSSNLLVKINGTADQLRVTNHFITDGLYAIEQIKFDDGTIWGASVISLAPITPTTTTAVLGTSGADYFDLTNSANSTVHGYSTSNVSSGADTYVFGSGSGQDTLRDYETAAGVVDTVRLIGVLPSDILVTRDFSGSSPASELLFKIVGSTDQLKVIGYFAGANYKIEKVLFDNGTEWGVSQLDVAPFDLRAVANSSLTQSTAGNDAYLFATGAGQDTITDNDSNVGNIDTIRLTGLTSSQVTLVREADSSGSTNLLVKVNGTADQLRVNSHFNTSGTYAIERVVFDDGTIWDSSVISLAPITPTTTSAALGTSSADYFDLRNNANSMVYGYTTGSNNSGDDTYIFGSGSGTDSLQDYGTGTNTDTVKVVGLTPSQITLIREADGSGSTNLLVKVNGTSDQLRVYSHFITSGLYAIEQVKFDDGTIWDSSVIAQAPITPTTAPAALGTSGADYFDLRNNANSMVYGYTTGSNNSGDDTYIFGSGSGTDSLQDYGTGTNTDTVKVVGLTPSQITLIREADGSGSTNLLVKVNGTSDQLRVYSHFNTSGLYAIEQVKFDDGTIWHSSVIAQAPITPTTASAVQGTSGADYFDLRNSANSTVYGYTGSSTNSGDDTYVFGAGSGQDAIQDAGTSSGNTDIVKVVSIDPATINLQLETSTTNLLIKIDETSDQLKVLSHFSSSTYTIEKIIFDSGAFWDIDVMSMANAMPIVRGTFIQAVITNGLDDVVTGTSAANTLTGTSLREVIVGGGGNDTINGGDGNDVLVGGDGNDSLTGGNGSDVFVFDIVPASTNRDTISDFDLGNDAMWLENAIFTALSVAGALSSGNFVTGSAAGDADDYVIYNATTGALYYDADGNGAGASQQIATLTGTPSITASSFVVI